MIERRFTETSEKVQPKRPIVLQNWEEALGNLLKVSNQDTFVTVELTCGTLIFHENSAEARILNEELGKSKVETGQKIGIIRIDDVERPVVIRKFPLEE